MLVPFRSVMIVVILIIIGTIYFAVKLHDPHLIQRGGALLAAVAASLAIMEATLERRVNEKSSLQLQQKPERGFSSFVTSTASRIHYARFRVTQSKLTNEKIRTVFFTSLLAVLGEILHGFGDLLFILILHK